MVLLKQQKKIQLIDVSENKPAASDTQCTKSSVWQMPNLLFQRTLVQAEPRAGVCSWGSTGHLPHVTLHLSNPIKAFSFHCHQSQQVDSQPGLLEGQEKAVPGVSSLLLVPPSSRRPCSWEMLITDKVCLATLHWTQCLPLAIQLWGKIQSSLNLATLGFSPLISWQNSKELWEGSKDRMPGDLQVINFLTTLNHISQNHTILLDQRPFSVLNYLKYSWIIIWTKHQLNLRLACQI